MEGRVRRLEDEAGRLYAVTPARLVVLDPESLRTLDAVQFDRFLGREALRRAGPSGLAVGEGNLYMTLEGEPLWVQIEKP